MQLEFFWTYFLFVACTLLVFILPFLKILCNYVWLLKKITIVCLFPFRQNNLIGLNSLICAARLIIFQNFSSLARLIWHYT